MSSEDRLPLTFVANNGDMGGGEVMLLRLARAARSLGHDVTVIAPTGELAVAARQGGFPVHVLPRERRSYVPALRKWARTTTELVWCHGLVPALATAGRPNRIVHLHRLPRGIHRAALTVARRGAQRVVVPSRWMAQHVPASTVLENWSDPFPGATASPPGKPELSGTSARSGVLTVGFIGRWAAEKGLDVLIRAVDRAAGSGLPIELMIAGEPRFAGGPEVREIERAIAAATIPVHRLGWVAPEILLSRIDVLAVPSRAPESFGLVAIEAMSRMVPVVSTDAGALPEVLGAGHPWIATAADEASLAAALRDFAGSSTAVVEAAARAGRRRWECEYSPEAALPRLRDFIHALPPVRTTG